MKKGTGRSPVPGDYSRGAGASQKPRSLKELHGLRRAGGEAGGGELGGGGVDAAAPEVEGTLGGDGDLAHEELASQACLEVAAGGDHAIEDPDGIRAARDGEAEGDLRYGHPGRDPLRGKGARLLDGPEAEEVLVAGQARAVVPVEEIQVAPLHA